jgi:hypothetical protein
MLSLPQPRPPLIVWPIRHNTWEEVTATTMHHENHEVSWTSIDGCGTNNGRGCCREWDNPAASDERRRLTHRVDHRPVKGLDGSVRGLLHEPLVEAVQAWPAENVAAGQFLGLCTG